jgi:tetratricopeptide (TPR) repeat protein
MSRDRQIPQRPAVAAVEDALRAAVAHIQANRLDEAAATLVAGGALKVPVGRNILGDIRLKQGRPRDALREFDAALAMVRGLPEAHCNRGVALQELGRLEDALAAEERAIALRPAYATAHFNRGNVLRDLGRTEEALAAYDQALKARPDYPEALVNRGMASIELGKAAEGLNDFRRALAARADYGAARIGAAIAHRVLDQFPEALAEIGRVLAGDPSDHEALLVKAGILTEAKRIDEALAIVDQLLAADPADAVVHVARANTLLKAKRPTDALDAAGRAVALQPKSQKAHLVRGKALNDLGRSEEALQSLDQAARLGPSGSEFHQVRAVILCDLGRLAESLGEYDLAIAGNPDNFAARYHRSFVLLAQGNHELGWKEHEWRLKLPTFPRPELLKVAPLWHGEDVTEKSVLLYSEQGAGDTIQFVRYAPLVAARGARVSMVVHESLRRLFAANFPDMDVSSDIGMRSGFDYQAPLMSLAQVFGTRAEADIPAASPYLSADPERIAKWRERLGADGFKIGISWQGNSEYTADRFRSIPLKRFAPLAGVTGIRLISLQALWGTEQLKDLPTGMTVETLGEELVNNPDGFREMAAVMANLDLMIVSDSAPAHLAGALARPVWVALCDRADWRWELRRLDSPWYPTMRLFRQKDAGDWDGVFAEIAAALSAAVARRGQP